MNNYNKVITIAKDLQEEFNGKLSIAEALQVAAQINLTDCLAEGLQTGVRDEPVFLEAIAMALGFAPQNERHRKSTVADSLETIALRE